MKRSPIKRGKPLSRGSKRLARGSKSLKRGGSLKRGSRMRQVGKRGRRAAAAVQEFRRAVLERAAGRCERCHLRPFEGLGGELEAHHIVPRSAAPGWDGLHKPANGAALCGGPDGCHARVHAHLVPDWREWIASSKSNARKA